MSSLSPSRFDDDNLPPPPLVKEDTAQLLSNILGDDDESDEEQEAVKTTLNGDDKVKESPLKEEEEEIVEAATTKDVKECVDEEEEGSDYESDGDYSSEEEEVILTTMEEKHSLIALASEHDRVDILQAILDQESKENQGVLLKGDTNKSPLEIAFQHQSTNAAACLLRLGAIPATFHDKFQHAFEAEALRAIGADEWTRVQQLINVLPHDFTIAHRTLYEWSVDMNASQCAVNLKPQKPQPTNVEEKKESPKHVDTNLQKPNQTHQNTNSTLQNATCHEETNAETLPNANQGTPSRTFKFINGDTDDECTRLEKQLEESEALSSALSNLLDTLAEEVSVTQGLLYNKNALLSHVKAIKNLRAQKQDELQEWKAKLRSFESELDMVTDYWYNYTNPESDSDDDDDDEDYDDQQQKAPILPLPQPPQKQTNQSSQQNEDDTNDIDDSIDTFTSPKKSKHTKEQWMELLECSKLRVAKLRASLTDLAEEKDSNLKEIEKRGLSGAVRMAQNLRDEVRELDSQLSDARTEAATLRLQIDTIRAALERLMNPPSSPNGTHHGDLTDENTPYLELEPPSNDDHSNSNHLGNETPATSTTTSKAVVPYRIQKGYLPIHIWDLILRIFGLGKRSVHRAVLGK